MIIRPQSLQSLKPSNHYNHAVLPHCDFKKKVENYTFQQSDKIGRGYSSTVYKGHNEITKDSVAIKVIELKSLKDQNTKKFLQNELECLRILDHPNLLRYVNSFMTTHNCYIITELYNGGDLAKSLKEKKQFGEDEVFQIFYQFYQGYKHFHSKGFIHRDIKPSNVLIQVKPNSKPVYAIADFGFIKHLDENPKDPFNVGTPVYMSPQSITSNIYTVKSDIWSMGVMLYEMAYGFLPFPCKNQSDLKRQICNKQLRLQELQQHNNIETSFQFKTFLLNCLRKNPENRISLEEIGSHVWFRKHSCFTEIEPRISLQNNHHSAIMISLSKQNLPPRREQRQYGYIGDQPIKRQKSLCANNFSTKSYSIRHDTETQIQNYRQKARDLGILNIKPNERRNEKQNQKLNKPNQKENKLKLDQHQPYFVQKYLKSKLNSNAFIQDSPKMKFFLQNKNSFENKSSMLEAMKGIVKIKNNQILKLNYDRKTKNPEKIRQDSENVEHYKVQAEISTSLDQNKLNSAESLKNNKKNCSRLPFIADFEAVSSELIEPPKGIQKIEKSFNNIQNNQNYANQSLTAEAVHSAIFTETFDEPSSQNLKKSIGSKQFCLKSLHLLRYIYENLRALNQYLGDRQRLNSVKQCLQEYFFIQWGELSRSLKKKQNIFELKDWKQFCETKNYQTFIEVIQKYHQKFSQSALISFKQNSEKRQDLESRVQKYAKENYSLLKLSEQLSSANKEILKKSLRNSPSFNAAISLISNLQNCLQTIIKACQNPSIFLNLNPEKQLESMNSKSKDPFRIQKIILQLKKKLISIQSDNSKCTINLLNQSIGLSNTYKSVRVSIM